jgi:hypothetical protein
MTKSKIFLKRILGLCSAILIFAIGAFSQTEQKPILAILNLSSQTVSQTDTSSIINFIQQEFFNSQKYQLIERLRIEKFLQEIHFQQSTLCDADCLARIGKQLAAQKVVIGTLNKLGNAYSIQLSMIDVASSTIESMYSSLEECSLEQLPGRIKKIVNGVIMPDNRQMQAVSPISQTQPAIKSSNIVKSKQIDNKKKKSPFLAFLLSIVPGLGQYYNGHVFKGILIDAIATTGLIFVIGGDDLSRSVFDDPDPLGAIGGCMLSAAWLGSLIDAPISAASINRKYAKRNAHLLNYLINEKQSLSFDFVPIYKGYMAKLTFSFQ